MIQALKTLNCDVTWLLEVIGECSGEEGNLNWHHLRFVSEGFGGRARIKLRRNISYSWMPEIFSNADLCVLPASNEPAAISALEALPVEYLSFVRALVVREVTWKPTCLN